MASEQTNRLERAANTANRDDAYSHEATAAYESAFALSRLADAAEEIVDVVDGNVIGMTSALQRVVAIADAVRDLRSELASIGKAI